MNNVIEWGLVFSLLVSLGTLVWMDWKYFRLPNCVTFPLMALGITNGWLFSNDWKTSAIGCFVGYAAFVFIELSFKAIRKKDGLGRGDAKLLAVGGAWCGWMALPYIVLISSMIGILFVIFPRTGRPHEEGWIPFGSFLAVAIALVFLTPISSH